MPNQKSVLVVDDEEDLRFAIAFDLRRRGYRVHEAGSGNEAFKLFKEHPVDIVISDVRMADGDGPSLLDRIMELKLERPPRLIFVTAFSDLRVQDVFDRGAFSVLPKPFERTEFFGVLERAEKAEPWTFPESKVEAGLPVVTGKGVLGRGGATVKCTDTSAFATGASVGFEMEASELGSVKGCGIVRWSEGGVLGLEITALDADSGRRYADWVQSKRPTAFIPASSRFDGKAMEQR